MLYTRKVFTVPASSGSSTSQRRWDYATLPKEQFLTKYEEYAVEPILKEMPLVEFHTNQVPAILPEHSGSVLVVK